MTTTPMNKSFAGKSVKSSKFTTDEEGFVEPGSFFIAGSYSENPNAHMILTITDTEREADDERLLTVFWHFYDTELRKPAIGYIIIDTEAFTPEPIDFQDWCIDWLASDGCELREWEICELLRP